MRLLNLFFYYGILIPVSYLPYPVLYLLSDTLYVIIYRMIGYRKIVVFQNIANSFPEKSSEERQQIADDFYRHLCDLVVESIKTFTITEKQIQQRFKITNPDFIDRFYDRHQSVILAGGHYNNWELFAVAIDAPIKLKAIALYKPLSNIFFDEKMRTSRGKFGLKMISLKATKEEFEKKDDLCIIIFAVDQSPRNPKNCHWSPFLNQDTATSFGMEKYAREFNYPVLYGHINKLKRGHYAFEFTEVMEEPQTMCHGAITNRINHLLEQDIIAKPAYWLWSHKRWKLKRPAALMLE